MREEVVEREITRVETKTVYIAEDGTQFDSKWKCQKYEEEVRFENAQAAIEKYHIEDLDNKTPISDSGDTCDTYEYLWYRVPDAAAEAEISNCYKEAMSNIKIKEYPEVIAIEDPGVDAEYAFTLSDMKELTESFFNELGIKVTFQGSVICHP